MPIIVCLDRYFIDMNETEKLLIAIIQEMKKANNSLEQIVKSMHSREIQESKKAKNDKNKPQMIVETKDSKSKIKKMSPKDKVNQILTQKIFES